MRAKTVSLSLLSATLLMGMTVTGLTGCGTNTDDTVRTQNVKDNRSINNDINRYGTRSVNDGLNTRGNNNMGNLRHSKELSDKIAKLKDVNSANVMLTDHNAYVAVSLNGGNNTMRGTSTNMNHNRGTGLSNLGNDGNMMGAGAPSISDTGSNMRNQTGGNYPANTDHSYGTVGTRNNGLMRGLTTTPTPTNDNMMDEDQYMTREVKDKIADLVKKSDPSVKNVYVSANPEFVDRVGNYVTDVSNGNPISGIANEFQTLVNRIFPTKSGNHMNNNEPTNGLNKMGR